MGDANIEKFLYLLPDLPELHGSLPCYYELILPRLSDVAVYYPSLKTVICEMEKASSRREELTLSTKLLRDYPMVWWSYCVFSEAVFGRIAPHLNTDYFEIAELTV